jgi:Zn-dependent peptidase ImmA (M78 family)
MKPVISDHPGYPFRDDLRRAFSARGSSFVDGPESGSPENAMLGEFLGLVHAYAFLERLVQGEILCELPVHIDRVLAGFLDPEDEGERLATQEAGLLEWTPESADSLVDALDELGVKVICWDDPDDGPARQGPRLGAFTFEGDAGPAVLVGASPHTPEAAFIAAHELGHLAADIDPYLPRFCRWDPHELTNISPRPEEARADRFARALLMPREAFVDAVKELGAGPADGPDPRAEQLAALFGVPRPAAIRRLADLGLPPVASQEPTCGPPKVIGSAAARAAGPETEATRIGARSESSVETPTNASSETMEGPTRSLTLPERFVNLALAAYAGHVLDIEGLARFLRITPHDALQMASLVDITPEPRDDWA